MTKTAGSVSKYLTKSGERLWRYRFDGDPVDGKRQVVSKQGFATRGAAMSAMQAATQGYQDSKTLPAAGAPQKETVRDWVRTWLRDYAPQRCTLKTIERYTELAAYILAATEGDPAEFAATPLQDAGRKHALAEAALYALLRAPAKRREHLSPKTIHDIANVFSVALDEALRLDKLAANPLNKVRLPKVRKKDVRALTAAEINALREVCRGDWLFSLIEVYLATGARRGELLALEWADIDFLNGVVTISKGLEETKKGLRIKRPKNDRTRKFKVGLTTLTVLRFEHEKQEERRSLLGGEYKGQLVFAGVDGAHLSPLMVSQNVKRRMVKAGIKDASLHTLRHTHASHLLSAGVPLKTVSERLGHADANTTLRIYTHMLPEDDARAADAWENIVAIKSPPPLAETPEEETKGPVQ